MEPVGSSFVGTPPASTLANSPRAKSDGQFSDVLDTENLKIGRESAPAGPAGEEVKRTIENVVELTRTTTVPSAAGKVSEETAGDVDTDEELDASKDVYGFLGSTILLPLTEPDRQHLPKPEKSAHHDFQVAQAFASLTLAPSCDLSPDVSTGGHAQIEIATTLQSGDSDIYCGIDCQAALRDSNVELTGTEIAGVIPSPTESETSTSTDPTAPKADTRPEPNGTQAKEAEVPSLQTTIALHDDRHELIAEDPADRIGEGSLKRSLPIESGLPRAQESNPAIQLDSDQRDNDQWPKWAKAVELPIVKETSSKKPERPAEGLRLTVPAKQEEQQEPVKILATSVEAGTQRRDVPRHEPNLAVAGPMRLSNDRPDRELQLSLNDEKSKSLKLAGPELRLIENHLRSSNFIAERDAPSARSETATVPKPTELPPATWSGLADRSNDSISLETLNTPVVQGTSNQSAHVERANVISQLIEKVHLVAGKNQSELTVSLKPEVLGRINLRASMVHDSLVATIMAESPHVKQLLESQMTSLQTALHEQGLQVSKIEVVQGNQLSFSEFGHEQPSPRQQFNSHYNPVPPPHFQGLDEEPAIAREEGSPLSVPWVRSTSGSLNLLA